jgi:hypothetical protein
MSMISFERTLLFCALILAGCFKNSGGELARVALVQIPGASGIVKAQRSADGTIHVVYDGEDVPFYTRSTDHGATFSPAIPVIDTNSIKAGLKFNTWDLAVGKDGKVHIAMGNNAWKLKLPEEQWSLHYATLERGEKAFSPVRNLNRKPSEGFSLAADDKGDVTAGFLSDRLYAMVSRDGGKNFDSWKEVNSEWNPCNCCTTAATYGADGRLALLYREETNNERDIYLVLWDQMKGDKPLRRRISATPWKLEGCPMTYFSISPTAEGYVAAWPTKGQIYFSRLNRDGEILPPGEIKTPGKNGMRTGIVALGAKDGATLIAWKNSRKLEWQLYDEKGNPSKEAGAAGSTASSGNGAAGVVLHNGRFLLFP